jgi:hypothetical protein
LVELCEVALSTSVDMTNVVALYALADRLHAAQLMRSCYQALVVAYPSLQGAGIDPTDATGVFAHVRTLPNTSVITAQLAAVSAGRTPGDSAATYGQIAGPASAVARAAGMGGGRSPARSTAASPSRLARSGFMVSTSSGAVGFRAGRSPVKLPEPLAVSPAASHALRAGAGSAVLAEARSPMQRLLLGAPSLRHSVPMHSSDATLVSSPVRARSKTPRATVNGPAADASPSPAPRRIVIAARSRGMFAPQPAVESRSLSPVATRLQLVRRPPQSAALLVPSASALAVAAAPASVSDVVPSGELASRRQEMQVKLALLKGRHKSPTGSESPALDMFALTQS